MEGLRRCGGPHLNRIAITFTLMLLVLGLAGCHEPERSGIPSFTYTSTDYAFTGPEELPAGWVTLVNQNDGQEPHHIQLFRLTGDRTLEDYEAALGDNETHPDWIEWVGGPNTPNPGASAEATLRLEPGRYVMICEIPDREGVPHVHHGMYTGIQVVEEDGADEPPEADLTVSMVEFAFAKQEDWTPGSHTVEVVNEGAQAHELVLVRYREGGNFSQLLQALGPDATGPPPASFLGGITGIASGDRMSFPVDLEAGRYGFICFLEDPETGAPHFALGMQQDFHIG